MRPRIRLTTSYAAHPQNFHHLSRFATISQNSKHPNAENENLLLTPEAHLLLLCVQQCKYIQSRRVFDEKPQRLLLALRSTKIIHAQSLKFGVGSEGPLANAIVDLYAKSGDHDFAEKVFQRLPQRDLSAWNSILSMYSKSGLLDKVVSYFGLLRNSGVLPNQFTYAIVASVSARLGNVRIGKQLHCDVIKMGFEFCSFCEGSLIDMYAKNNCMIDARQIFDGAKPRDTISWTAIIGGYVRSGMPFEALRLFDEMQKVGLLPDEVTYVTVVTACVGLGRLEEAKDFFAQICNPKVVAWNVMISGHSQKGHEVEAIDFFINMRKCGIRPTRSTLGSVLSAISNLSYYSLGVLVHALAIKEGLDSNVYVGSSLINMYAKCQKTEAAKEVFDALDEKNVVLWNTMIGCYAQNGRSFEVMDMFSVMRASIFVPDEYTHTSILSACACLDNLDLGQQLHSFIIKNKYDSNLFVANALVDMYAKCGALEEARQQFELIKNRDKVSWNAIIVGYVQEEYENQAFSMFRRMMADSNNPDEVSLASILSACANLQAIEKGKQIHGFSVKIGLETSLFSGSSLIDMYVKCGAVEAAEKVLSSMPEWSVVSINALISGYAQERLEEAINLFQLMQAQGMDPSEITLASLLDACTDPSQLNIGRQIHCYALKTGLLDDRDFLVVSLLGMYLNCQRTADANILFHELPCPRSTILWTAVISGHIQNNNIEEALLLYQEMRRDNARPDQATYACVLKACANLALLRDGREIHSLIFHTGYDLDESTCSTLVDIACYHCSLDIALGSERGNNVCCHLPQAKGNLILQEGLPKEQQSLTTETNHNLVFPTTKSLMERWFKNIMHPLKDITSPQEGASEGNSTRKRRPRNLLDDELLQNSSYRKLAAHNPLPIDALWRLQSSGIFSHGREKHCTPQLKSPVIKLNISPSASDCTCNESRHSWSKPMTLGIQIPLLWPKTGGKSSVSTRGR
ncbi:Pentatricopeptide repeat [Dillenia turbinata]|uniref:Pentatricopeptide repeat n=1 Tax=Dillenia turbinata TaxID=194707 RepID=A0AAN8W1W2_9MAGN